MSHFDWIVNGLAVIGFLTLCFFFCFFAVMVKNAWEHKQMHKKSLEALRTKWRGVAIEQH